MHERVKMGVYVFFKKIGALLHASVHIQQKSPFSTLKNATTKG